jgi:hypothetical protein
VRSWNATFLPAPGSRDGGIEAACASQSGWGWRWEEDVETWTYAEVHLRGAYKVARDAFSADRDVCREWVELVDGRLASTRCSLCTFMHGPPTYRPEGQPFAKAREMDVVHPGVPEDIAIWGAKLLGQLRAASTRTEPHLCPADVTRMAQRFDIIAAEFTAYLNVPSPEQEWRLLSLFDPQHVGPGSASDRRAAVSAGIFADVQAQVQFRSEVEKFQRHWTRM